MMNKMEKIAGSAPRLRNCIPCYFDPIEKICFEIEIPSKHLSELTSVHVRTLDDLRSIPATSGNYWILTNEPINHCFHAGKHVPEAIRDELRDDFFVVYNGTTSSLRSRTKQHLLRTQGGFGSQSGISVDMLKHPVGEISHVKYIWGEHRKLPKIIIEGEYRKPPNKEAIVSRLYLTEEERTLCNETDELYFKNGINVQDEKHIPFQWIFVYMPIEVHEIRDYIEREWRKLYGIPCLCSYSIGR